jgi:hypothetical protein
MKLSESTARAMGLKVDARDQLVDVRKCGLEENTVRELMAAGELPWRKMGRRTYTRLSHLLALIPERGKAQEPGPALANANSLEAIAARMTSKRGAQ